MNNTNNLNDDELLYIVLEKPEDVVNHPQIKPEISEVGYITLSFWALIKINNLECLNGMSQNFAN